MEIVNRAYPDKEKHRLAYVTTESINNPMVREVFGLEDKDKVKASRIIKDTIEGGFIKPLDSNTAPR